MSVNNAAEYIKNTCLFFFEFFESLFNNCVIKKIKYIPKTNFHSVV